MFRATRRSKVSRTGRDQDGTVSQAIQKPGRKSLVIAYELPTRTLGHSSDKWHSGIDSVVSCFSHVLVDGGNFCLVRGVAHDNRNVLSRCLILNDVLAGPNSPSACARVFASSRACTAST